MIEPGALAGTLSGDEDRATSRFRGLLPAIIILVGLAVLFVAVQF